MRIKLIYPDWGNFPLYYRRYISTLSLPTVAGLTPPDIDVSFTDERIEEIDFNDKPDLVGISSMTCQAYRAYEIAKIYREKGVPVVIGGVHPSLNPEEAQMHTDAVVIGEAEESWPRLIEDFRKGQMQKTYSCPDRPDLKNLCPPRRDLLEDKGYIPMDSVQISRGCPINCDFCAVPSAFGKTFRQRPIPAILDELKSLKKHLFFVDDNMILNKRYTLEFFDGLAKLGIKWTGLGPLNLVEDEKYFNAMIKSGVWLLYVDVGPWLSANMSDKGKHMTQMQKYLGYMKRLKDNNIKIIGSFVFGFDYDEKSVFENTVNFAKAAEFDEIEFLILTPYPNSRLHQKLEAENRIINRDLSKYTTTNVVFKPKNMTPDELYTGYINAWKEFYPKETYEETKDGIIFKTMTAFPLSGMEFEGLLNTRYKPEDKWVSALVKKDKLERVATNRKNNPV